MKPFIQIVRPDEDILKGTLTMDVFAADLWQVVKRRAPVDYQDPELFFKKTYLTNGLKNILEIARARLGGQTGDATIQLQTPFGGGKTHTLISLYHKAGEWKAKVVVFDGTALNPDDSRPWEELEKQLTGKTEIIAGNISPGTEKLIQLLSENAPVLILMDELLEYITRAAGVKVGDSNLASQTFAFIQELTAAVATVGNALLVLTLPSSILEHYDENAERMFQKLQKITGRVEKIYTPVEDEEIELVIKKRLFSNIEESEVKKTVNNFVEFAKSEGLLSSDDAVRYRERFFKSFPFKPEVIDTLYKRWGTFPTFQRARGVLRLLSLVVHSLLDKNIPFIRLGDFNLDDNEIRRELIKHIGNEWDSIVAQDITSKDSGAKKIDTTLSASYLAYKLGTVVSTTIFMKSFSGKVLKGSSVKEIKLSSVYPEIHASEIDNVINNLKEKLFYLSDEGLYFTNQPNLNRIIVVKEEAVDTNHIFEEKRRLIKEHLSNQFKFKVYLYPKFTRDIPDNSELKLIILNKGKPEREFLEKYGENPRIYRNVLIFLCLDESQKESCSLYIRKLIALKAIKSDGLIKLTEAQENEIKRKLENIRQRSYEELRKLYRRVYLPAKNNFKEIDLGLPTFGENFIDKEIYEILRNQGEILERIAPRVLNDKYLSGKDYVEIKKLYEAFLKTPGEIRLVLKESFIESIKEGVKIGLFGFGHLNGDKIECKYIKEVPVVNMEEGEIIIKSELCGKVKDEDKSVDYPVATDSGNEEVSVGEITPTGDEKIQQESNSYSKLELKLRVPTFQISTIARMVNYLNEKFEQCSVEIKISAQDGKIYIFEYEDKILESLIQGEIEILEENKE